MDYHTINFSSDSKITGIPDGSPQCEIPIKYRKGNYDKIIAFLCSNDPHEFWSNIGEFSDFSMNLEFVRLKKKAKLTDFLDMSPVLRWTFLVSDRVLDIFSSFKLSPYKKYKVNLVTYNEEPVRGYKFLHIPALDYKSIDFQKSVFFSGGLSRRKHFRIDSPEEFEKAKDKKVFDVETLAFKKNINLDLFCPRPAISQFYISKGLKDALERNNVTGIDIRLPKDPVLIFQ